LTSDQHLTPITWGSRVPKHISTVNVLKHLFNVSGR